MTNAKAILIYTKGYTPPPAPKPISELLVVATDSQVKLDRATLDAHPRDPEPGEREARDTWTLQSIVETAHKAPGTSLRLTDGQGKTLDLTPEQLAAPGSKHILKRNRRGLFNYRRWSTAKPAKRVGELRGVVSIELL